MTSYLPPSDDVSNLLWILRDFVPEYHPAKFGRNWTTNKGKIEGGDTLCRPSLNMGVLKNPAARKVNILLPSIQYLYDIEIPYS